MAITRAQQVKQMLREGGRIGLRRGSIDRGFSAPSKAGQSPRGTTTARGGPPTRSGGSGSRNVSSSNLSARDRYMGSQGKTGKVDKSLDVGGSGPDDRGNPLQNRNQRNIVAYNEGLAAINANRNLGPIERFNAKKRLRNQRFVNQKYSQLAAGMAEQFGLSQDQIQALLDAYDRDLDKFDLSTFRGIVDAGGPPTEISSDPNFLEAQMLDYSKRMSKIDPETGKRIPLSTAELFSTTDPTSRIELPSPFLNALQGPESFSNVLSGLNRLKTLDTLSNIEGGVPQDQIDNYFNLTAGKGGKDPITGEEIPFLFNPKDDNDRSMTVTDPCKGPNPPAYCFIGEKADETVETQRNLGGLAPRFAGSIFDFTGMADGGRIGAAEGGIMDLARQEMFLGGIAKSISKGLKKATRAVKKVAKSPIGKAALLYFGGKALMPGGLSGLQGTLFGQAGSRVGQSFIPYKEGLFTKLGLTKGGGSLMPTLLGGGILGLGGLSLFGNKEEEEDLDMGPELTMAQLRAIRNSPYRYTAPRFEGSQYKFADGGRIGLRKGTAIIQGLEKLAKLIKKKDKRKLTDDEYENFVDELGGGDQLEAYTFDGTVGDAKRILKENKEYYDEMELLYKKGKLDPKPGEANRQRFLQKKFDEMELSGDKRLMTIDELEELSDLKNYAQGGRIGLKGGTGSKILNFLKPFGGETKGGKQLEGLLYGSEGIGEILRLLSSSGMFAEGGDVEPVAKKTMPLLDMDGKEMDLRAEGGFVPIGRMEKADDVPARLSKNEFVFTADAVRNAGDGDVDKGAEVMYNMMKNLESGGDVSEESQGLEGARDMFQTSKRLEEVI